ncbi:MAG TPA: L-rhamnose mutarotase [Clostridia bacterium]
MRYGRIIKLIPERVEVYKMIHAEPWKSITDILRAAHISNYSIFLYNDLLFSYYEYDGDNYKKDMAWIAEQPEMKRWREITDPCQTPVEGAKPGEWWKIMEEIFHME